MRDLALAAVFLIGIAWTIRYPFVGVLLWTWITMMDPHQLTFGFIQNFQTNLIVAVVTLGSWFFSKTERKWPPLDANFYLIVAFFLWMTLNTVFSVWPAMSWLHWDMTWRLMLLGVLVSIVATDRVRIHALVMVMAMSLLFYGVKGGGFTLTNGGVNHVQGPANTTIGDNNQLALAILMALPLANYVRLHAADRRVRYAFAVGMVLSLFSVLGSYSRGAFIALAGLLVIAWFRSKKKWLYPAVAVIVIPALHFMPGSYFDRISTIQNPEADGSFRGRVEAWHVAFGYARDHFPFGAGFDGPQLAQIYSRYEPGAETRVAHSIFFQVLGDNGFGGFAIYVLLLLFAFYNARTIRRMTRGRPEFSWAFDLAGMLQLTLFVFCLGGAALSFAYYDGLWICLGLLSAMRELVLRSTRSVGWKKGAARSAISHPALAAPGLAAE